RREAPARLLPLPLTRWPVRQGPVRQGSAVVREDRSMQDNPQQSETKPDEARTVVVVGPDGRPVGTVEVPTEGGDGEREDPSRLIEQPAKVMRIGSMIKQLLEEVRAAPLDDAGRQ